MTLCSVTTHCKSMAQHPEMGRKPNEWLEWSQRRLSDLQPTCQVVQGLVDPRSPYALLSNGTSVCLRVPAGPGNTSFQNHCFPSGNWVPGSKWGPVPWQLTCLLSEVGLDLGSVCPSKPLWMFIDMCACSASCTVGILVHLCC